MFPEDCAISIFNEFVNQRCCRFYFYNEYSLFLVCRGEEQKENCVKLLLPSSWQHFLLCSMMKRCWDSCASQQFHFIKVVVTNYWLIKRKNVLIESLYSFGGHLCNYYMIRIDSKHFLISIKTYVFRKIYTLYLAMYVFLKYAQLN